jgi:hypothetical protein
MFRFLSNFSHLVYAKFVIIGHQFAKPHCNRFKPTKAVNKYQYRPYPELKGIRGRIRFNTCAILASRDALFLFSA